MSTSNCIKFAVMVLTLGPVGGLAAELPWIVVADDRVSFVREGVGEPGRLRHAG